MGATAASALSFIGGGPVATGVIGSKIVDGLMGKGKKPPELTPPTLMPDPLAQQQAEKQRLIRQMADRGRVSTVLTDSGGSGKLGG